MPDHTPNIFTTFKVNRDIFSYLQQASTSRCFLFMEDAIAYYDTPLYLGDPDRFILFANCTLKSLNLYTTDYEHLAKYKELMTTLIFKLVSIVNISDIHNFLWTVKFNITDVVSNLKDVDKITNLFDNYCQRHGINGHSIFLNILHTTQMDPPYTVHLANLCFDYDKVHKHYGKFEFYLDIHKSCNKYIYEQNDDLSYKLIAMYNSDTINTVHNDINQKIERILQFKYPGTYAKYLTTAKLLDMADNMDFWRTSYLSNKLTYSDADFSQLELC